MGKNVLIAYAVMVASSAHDGYRRAGVAFANGENHFEANTFTDTQLAQIKADRHLAVSEPLAQTAPDSPAVQTGAVDTGSLSASLTEKTLTQELTLLEAIAQLSPDNSEHFTGGGKPKTEALADLVGKSVSAAERDAAWDEFQKQADADKGGE